MAYDQERQFDRFKVSLAVFFQQGGERISARSRDISLGGMFVETDRALPYGTAVALEVQLPALRELVVIEATVRWSGPQGMGMQWGVLRAKETWAINQLIRG